jgi:PAS domain S-box-containing protein
MAIRQTSPTAQSTAKLEHERLTSLINNMADGVIAVDEHVRVKVYNGAALNILDSNSTIMDKSLGRFMDVIDKNNQQIDIVELIRAAKTSTFYTDMRLKYTDGSTINLYLNIAPVHLGYGREGERGFVLILRDITREKSLEEERDEFISVVSHELRTPIAIAEGNISNAQFTVDKNGDIDQVKQALKEAHNQVLFLADMINDLSTLSRAERGKLVMDIIPINVYELVTELDHNYGPQAEAKGLKLVTEIDPQNFITNSIKYTEKGSVTLAAHNKQGGVQFAVSDTGIGISKPDVEKIFDKFFRSEDYRTRSTNGTGLGLYVTMKLARLLHAEINVTSKLNHGSTFTVFVPNLQ